MAGQEPCSLSLGSSGASLVITYEIESQENNHIKAVNER